MKLYQISGLGANGHVFRNLKIDKEVETEYIPWLQPEPNESLTHYSERMLNSINPKDDFMLMGISFGGIVAQEINRLIDPLHTFLISTVKTHQELPPYMRLSARVNAHKVIPMSFLTSEKAFSYMMLRKLYYSNREKDAIDEIFEYKDPYYLSWSINQIVNWHNEVEVGKNTTHLHGNRDIVFPSKYIQEAKIIEGGTHIMIMQKPKIISEEINTIIKGL